MREIIEDPYGWIESYYDPRWRGERHVGDALLKLHKVSMPCQTRRTTYGFDEGIGPTSDVQFEAAWAAMADVGHDKLAIPRTLRWSTLPRSREYMNMEVTYTHLWRVYQRALYRDALATAEPTEPEYGEPSAECALALVDDGGREAAAPQHQPAQGAGDASSDDGNARRGHRRLQLARVCVLAR